jgi:hypothetical protein
MTGGGLRPPAPSSVEPSGIPTRPADDVEPIPLGEEADAAGPANEPLLVTLQVPEALPTLTPPSNVEAELALPAEDVPAMVLPMPRASSVPKDACGIEPPIPPH